MNTGTRLTLLQSKGLNIYAVKTGTGWELHSHSERGGFVYKDVRELSSRRVNTMIEVLLAIGGDINSNRLPDPPSYTPVDPFAEDMPF